MSQEIDLVVIDKSGVSVGGKLLRGCTRWTAPREPARDIFEVQLTLVSSAFNVDLDAVPGYILPLGSNTVIHTLPDKPTASAGLGSYAVGSTEKGGGGSYNASPDAAGGAQ